MKNTMKISLVTLLAILFLSSCGNGYNSDDYKKNTSSNKTPVVIKEVKNEKTDM
jgi:hypothetical protein